MSEPKVGIECRSVAPFFKNGYVVYCRQTRQAAYIDPGDEVDSLLDWAHGRDLELTSVINTHGHLDHICGIGALKARCDVPVYLHPDDEPLYDSLVQQGAWFGLNLEPAPPVDRYLQAGQVLVVGQLRLTVHHTPGHSPGSVCLAFENHVLTGDLVFAGAVGRVDLPGGSSKQLLRSIAETILTLPDDVVLLPGHGEATSVGAERRGNPFLRGL